MINERIARVVRGYVLHCIKQGGEGNKQERIIVRNNVISEIKRIVLDRVIDEIRSDIYYQGVVRIDGHEMVEKIKQL